MAVEGAKVSLTSHSKTDEMEPVAAEVTNGLSICCEPDFTPERSFIPRHVLCIYIYYIHICIL